LSSPFPDLARRVVELLRRDVPRPAKLPRYVYVCGSDGGMPLYALRFRETVDGFREDRCPLGLHPQARSVVPISRLGIPLEDLTNQEIHAFGLWWDEQLDPGQAVAAVWDAPLDDPVHELDELGESGA